MYIMMMMNTFLLKSFVKYSTVSEKSEMSQPIIGKATNPKELSDFKSLLPVKFQ